MAEENVREKCLDHFANLPIVSGSWELMKREKEANNGLLSTMIAMGEEGAHIFYENTYPIYQRLPFTDRINDYCIAHMKFIEANVAMVNKTPEQISKEYYEGSFLEATVNKLVSSTTTITGKVQNVKSVVMAGPEKLVAFSRMVLVGAQYYFPAGFKLFDVLGFGESLLYMTRNVLYAMKETASKNQRVILDTVLNLYTYGKSLSERAGKMVGNVKTQAQKAIHDVESRAKSLNVKPEVLLMWWIKSACHMMMMVTTSAAKVSKMTLQLPESAQLSADSIAEHFQQLGDSINDADSLGQLGEELKAEAGEVSSVVSQVVIDSLEKVSDTPPFAWLPFFRKFGSKNL